MVEHLAIRAIPVAVVNLRQVRDFAKAILYMATLSAIRFNPIIRPFYQYLIANGKLPKIAHVACMRKLLVILNAMVRTNTRFQMPSCV